MEKTKIIFLDRDGVLNTERKEYTYHLSHFSMVEGIGDALAALKEKGFLFVVATNQSGIAKGIYTRSDMQTINKAIAQHLANYGVEIAAWYYCPHHPDYSLCTCRKPDSGMLERGLARFKGNKTKSWFIGDKERDIEAGKKAGLLTLKIESNEDLRPYIKMLNNV
ncbi:HAD-IIIA family hydrolase [bacterium]|nr:HAD-IIIA family hydrolase [bacterium]